METSYIVTFIGNDRPGLVESVSRVIEQASGNWHESRLSQLGGKFAGLILVSLPADNVGTLESSLKSLTEDGLSVRVTPTGPGTTLDTPRSISLTVIGPDRLGMAAAPAGGDQRDHRSQNPGTAG